LKHCGHPKADFFYSLWTVVPLPLRGGDSFRDRLEFHRVCADLFVMDYSPGRSQELDADDQSGARHSPGSVELRRHPRFPLHADIRVYSRSAGLLTGYTVDISESGVSAMLRLELPIGELVELEFELPSGPVAIRAMVRHRTAFRYGFQFVEPEPEGVIKATCSRLGATQGNDEDAPSR